MNLDRRGSRRALDRKPPGPVERRAGFVTMPGANETKITGNGPFLFAPRSGSRTNATLLLVPGPFPRRNVTFPRANGTFVEAPGQGVTGIVEGLDENVEELDENVEGTEARVEGATAIGPGMTRLGQGGSGTVEGTRESVERPGRNGARRKTNVDFPTKRSRSRHDAKTPEELGSESTRLTGWSVPSPWRLWRPGGSPPVVPFAGGRSPLLAPVLRTPG